jgi:lysozyme
MNLIEWNQISWNLKQEGKEGKTMSLKGIDTSKWQAGLPDATIEADFIIFKATEGVGYTDLDCTASYAEAKAAGKLLGVYHFARPDGNGPIEEADWFLSQIQGYIGEAIMVLDWEQDPKSNVAWAKQWLDRVYNKTGIRPMIYMSTSVVNSYNWSSVADAGYALWVAQYADMQPDYNYDMSHAGAAPDVNWWPAGYAMWQWTSSGILNGYGGRLDCNLFYGDAKAWKAFAQGHPEVVVIPPSQPQPPVVVPPVVTPPVVTPPVVTPPVVIPPVVTPPIVNPPVVIPPIETLWQKIWAWIISFIKGVK